MYNICVIWFKTVREMSSGKSISQNLRLCEHLKRK